MFSYLAAIIIILVINIIINDQNLVNCVANCPPPQIVYPCECSNNLIYCGHRETRDLSNIFAAISRYLANDSKEYLVLDLTGIGVRQLEANVFHGLQFKRIYLRDLHELRHIDAQAFNGTQEYTEELTIEGQNRLLNDQTFASASSSSTTAATAIRSLVNLQLLYMDNREMTVWPNRALGNLRHLRDLDLNFNRRPSTSGGPLKRVDSFAFYEQNLLEDIDITGQSVEFVGKNAFTFSETAVGGDGGGGSAKLLRIFLDDNHLDSTGLERGLFAETNRPVELFVRRNRFQTIDEPTFGPFFAANPRNKLDIGQNPLVLDCRMAWLTNTSKIDIYGQILGGETANDGRHIMFLDSQEFAGC